MLCLESISWSSISARDYKSTKESDKPATTSCVMGWGLSLLNFDWRLQAYRTSGGHILVQPLINGREVGYMILDTGASGFVIEKDAADRLGLAAFGELYVAGLARKVRQARPTTKVAPSCCQNGAVIVRGLAHPCSENSSPEHVCAVGLGKVSRMVDTARCCYPWLCYQWLLWCASVTMVHCACR